MKAGKQSKTKGTDRIYIGVKLPAEHAKELRAVALRMDMTVSQLFRRMVRESIAGAKHLLAEKPF